MSISISVPEDKAVALQTLATNMTKENIDFLAAISKHPKCNEKLKRNQGTLKAFL